MLPDELLYKVLSFAETEAGIGPFLGSLSRVNKAMKRVIDNDSIWEMVLSGSEYHNHDVRTETPRNASSSLSSATAALLSLGRKRRRESTRLRRTTAKEEVIHAYYVLRDQTEMAIQDVAELCISSKSQKLTLPRLRATLHRYGTININQRSRNGETFLVECCRARHVSERIILHCVTELITVHHANPNYPAFEGTTRATVPALVIAAARGMPSIVKYLLSVGAIPTQEGTSRFRLHTHPSKSIRGTYTPLDFARRMREEEILYGATDEDLQTINACVDILLGSTVACHDEIRERNMTKERT